ncbi:LpxI family protein [Marivivens donghaensis]|jgi:UDP-2,3-diacylglucosamine hydrolase|uniref:LpxI family protein n=1 Tax=Marivivens donghaensis TaxID=1699413 RepID=UPI003F6A4413
MIALIAGTGALPAALVTELQVQGETPLICIFGDFEPDVSTDLPRLRFRLETLGSFISELQRRGVTEVCLAGAVRRPDVDPSLIDAETAPLVPRLMAALGQGDDGALRVILSIFEEAGIAIRAAHEIAPTLLPPSGVLTVVRPSDQNSTDAAVGQAFVADMGRRDSGQACVVRAGEVISEEGPDGTDAMIGRLCLPIENTDPMDLGIGFIDVAVRAFRGVQRLLTDDVPTPLLGESAILFKAPKPNQDRRADLPVIGPKTALGVAEAGMDGIVIEAGGVMVMDLPQVIATLDAHGMFLWVRVRG